MQCASHTCVLESYEVDKIEIVAAIGSRRYKWFILIKISVHPMTDTRSQCSSISGSHVSSGECRNITTKL